MIINLRKQFMIYLFIVIIFTIYSCSDSDNPTISDPPISIDTLIIYDLEVVDSTFTSLTLQWTAIANSESYDLRYLHHDIDSTNWDSGVSCDGLPMPAPAGSIETYTLSNLLIYKDYFFALVAKDSAGNSSRLRIHSVRGRTIPYYYQYNSYGIVGDAFTIFDMDNDGDKDIVTNTDHIWILENTGSGEFVVKETNPQKKENTNRSIRAQETLFAQRSAQTVNDFNNDGILDIAITSPWYELRTFLNDGTGDFSQFIDYSDSLIHPSWLCSDDFNGDGIVDIAASIRDADLMAVMIGEGNAEFAPPVYYEAALDPHCIIAGDINGDDILDLVMTNKNSNNISVYIGKGDGTFASSVYYFIGQTPLFVTLYDFDLDNDLDIAVTIAGPPNGVAILENPGTGVFSKPPVLYGAGDAPKSIDVADVDNDGYGDILISNGRFVDYVAILINNQDGTFKEFFKARGSGPEYVRAGDIDMDGDLDLVILAGDEAISVFPNKLVE
ncbi:MAG: FG-GAP-like repeat-containing protein [Candidatus Zixiibacteriota bacterium]